MTNMNTMQKQILNNLAVAIKRRTWGVARLLLVLGSFALLATPASAESKKQGHEEGGWKTAHLTTYTSYPRCCKGSPAYDPHADKGECEDYSGCKYQGEFAAIGKKPFAWVKENNIIAFYDDDDKSGKNFNKKYGGKKIKLRKNGKEFTAVIADTCGNQDCDNCCTKNSKGGYLVDIEFWTAVRNLGGANKADGTIEFQIE